MLCLVYFITNYQCGSPKEISIILYAYNNRAKVHFISHIRKQKMKNIKKTSNSLYM